MIFYGMHVGDMTGRKATLGPFRRSATTAENNKWIGQFRYPVYRELVKLRGSLADHAEFTPSLQVVRDCDHNHVAS
jgi:hypothetical protein